MIKNIVNITGVVVLKKEHQKSVFGGIHNCNVARKCFTNYECCSGICGVEKIINGRPVVLSICAL